MNKDQMMIKLLESDQTFQNSHDPILVALGLVMIFISICVHSIIKDDAQ